MFFFYLTRRCLGWRNGSAVKEHLLLLQRTWVLFPASTLSSGTPTPTSGLCRQLQACGVYIQMRVNPHSTHKQINRFSKGKEMFNKLQLSWLAAADLDLCPARFLWSSRSANRCCACLPVGTSHNPGFSSYWNCSWSASAQVRYLTCQWALCHKPMRNSNFFTWEDHGVKS